MRQRKGYALLLEVLLGLALFTMAVLFVMRLFPASDAAVAHSIRVVQATQLARDLLEVELDKDYNNPANVPAGGADSLITLTGTGEVKYASRRGSELLLPYTYQVDVIKVDDDGDLYTIDVLVEWSTGTGSTRMTRNVKLHTQRGNWKRW